MQRMPAGAETKCTAVVAHRVAGRTADLCEGRPCFRDFNSVDHQAGAVAMEQVEGVSPVGWDVDEAIPNRGVAGESLRVGLEIGGLAIEDRVQFLEIGQLGPDSG